MAILPKSGRAAIAKAIKDQNLHMAWGTGDGEWTTPPVEQTTATALMNEVGRRPALEVAFVEPNSDGEIAVEGAGRFTRSTTETNQLYLTFKFDFADASSEVIREIGVFVGTETDPDLPAGQMYFVPSEVVNGGTLLQLENKAPIYRSASTRENFEILITF